MKISKWSIILMTLLLAISLNACQSSTVTPHPAATREATSAPGESYPGPTQETGVLSAYPEPPSDATPTQIDYQEALTMILMHDIAKIVQTQSLEVTLYTKDARLFKTTEPALNDFLKTIEKCGSDCTEIQVVTQ